MLTTLLCLALAAPHAEPPTLLSELTTVGLDIPGGQRFKVPEPAMAAGLSLEKKMAVVEKYADKYPRNVFLKRASDAPHVWKIDSVIGPNKKRRGHQLDLYCVAYGKVDELDRKNMLGTLMGMNRKDEKETEYLKEKDLEARKITVSKIKGVEERFVLMDLDLIEKVNLTGVLRNQKSWDKDALISAMTLDDRFANDKEYPNRWRAITQDKGAKLGFGPPIAYSGFGGYVKATPVKDDMVFIEMHFVFAEPFEWFDGRNLLASKLPLVLKSNVKTMRLKMVGK